MEILGYIAYALLVLLAVIWTAGVRANPDVGVHTIIGALFFVVGAVVLPLSGETKLHALWIIPVGFALSAIVIPLLALHMQAVFSPIRALASGFAALVRLGK